MVPGIFIADRQRAAAFRVSKHLPTIYSHLNAPRNFLQTRMQCWLARRLGFTPALGRGSVSYGCFTLVEEMIGPIAIMALVDRTL